MKWGNTFFLKKRYKSGRWRSTGAGMQYAWTTREKFRLSRIYGIPDVVDKINSISWSGSGTNIDNHSYFQFWNGKNVKNAITWDGISGSPAPGVMISVDPDVSSPTGAA